MTFGDRLMQDSRALDTAVENFSFIRVGIAAIDRPSRQIDQRLSSFQLLTPVAQLFCVPANFRWSFRSSRENLDFKAV